MTDHTTPETGWHTLASHMVAAEPRRSLWAPRHEPMRVRDYVGATVLAVFGAAAFLLVWVGVPA